jgi:hypothetical protein
LLVDRGFRRSRICRDHHSLVTARWSRRGRLRVFMPVQTRSHWNGTPIKGGDLFVRNSSSAARRCFPGILNFRPLDSARDALAVATELVRPRRAATSPVDPANYPSVDKRVPVLAGACLQTGWKPRSWLVCKTRRNRSSFHNHFALLRSDGLREILDFRNDRVLALRGLRPK